MTSSESGVGEGRGEQNVKEISSSRLLYHQKHGNMIFMLPTSSTIPSLVPFEFINRLVEVLESYFGSPLISTKIETNLDTVAMILNEMLDGGVPSFTEPDPMRDLVPYGGLFSKLLAGNSRSRTPKSQEVPWRRAEVRHTNNELFVDLVETLYVIAGSDSSATRTVPSSSAFYTSYSSNSSVSGGSNVRTLLCRAEGTIIVTSHLSGIPKVELTLATGPHKLDYPSFHPCVELDTWRQRPGTVSFIPPDGKHLVASYTLEDKVQPGVVFADIKRGLGVNKDEFEVRVWTNVAKDVKAVEGLSVNVVCDSKLVRGIKNQRVTGGDFHFSDRAVGEWRFPGKVPMGWSATLRGVLQRIEEEELRDEDQDDDDGNVDDKKTASVLFPSHLTLSYNLTGQVPSGTKVHDLRITSTRGLGEGVKPFKGVRYVTRVGEYVVR